MARETMTTMEGLGDDPMVIAEEMKSRLLAGLNFDENGRVGSFAFFKYEFFNCKTLAFDRTVA